MQTNLIGMRIKRTDPISRAAEQGMIRGVAYEQSGGFALLVILDNDQFAMWTVPDSEAVVSKVPVRERNDA